MEYTGDRNSRGEPHGRGTMTHRDGYKYTGEFKDGKRHGQGTETDRFNKYTGEWKDDKRNGKGTESGIGRTYTDERRYRGGWKDDKRHGQGTATFADGSKRTEEWKDGKLLPLSWRLCCCRLLDSLRILKTPP